MAPVHSRHGETKAEKAPRPPRRRRWEPEPVEEPQVEDENLGPIPEQTEVCPPLPEMGGPPCAPRQINVESIKVTAPFDVGGCSSHALTHRYNKLMKGQMKRAKKIGPGVFCEKPITPHHNPSNAKGKKLFPVDEANPKGPQTLRLDPVSGHSYHAIELRNKSKTKMRVQLLVCDYNLYIVGFRRFKDNKWSSWYTCSDVHVPQEFNAISMGIDGDHRIKSKMGGGKCLNSMFFALANYPENTANKDKLRKAFLRAVVYFSEALRLFPVYDEIIKRIWNDANETLLPDHCWPSINGWGNLGEFALVTGKNKGKMNMYKFVKYVRSRGIVSFSDLVGTRKSVLMLLMREEDALLDRQLPLQLRGVSRPGHDVKDRGFESD
ncbi:uncharacterized protein [Lolium perenne]|uniref:uncharacterized protein n=1 Tax=Lolium perenne TaxID=4522 RepID=UPI0021EB0916|nr:uncharacterized protein LOC127349326 [Lolium perenne]